MPSSIAAEYLLTHRHDSLLPISPLLPGTLSSNLTYSVHWYSYALLAFFFLKIRSSDFHTLNTPNTLNTLHTSRYKRHTHVTRTNAFGNDCPFDPRTYATWPRMPTLCEYLSLECRQVNHFFGVPGHLGFFCVQKKTKQ